MSSPPWIGTQPPPVAARPRCPQCASPLRPVIDTRCVRVYDGQGFRVRPVSREWLGLWRGYGAFCSLRCCEGFANAAHRAGFRRATAPP